MTTAAVVGASHWRNPGWKALVLTAAAGIVMGLARTAAIVFLYRATPQGPKPEGIETLPLFLLFLVPFEEWLFRGVLLNRLIKPVGVIAALVLSSAAFAFAHGWGFPSIVFRFVGGLLLGAFYLRTGSLWPPIAMHFAYDETYFAAMYLLTPGSAVTVTS
jgi:membrane protease YdiL (CAAX protease family)